LVEEAATPGFYGFPEEPTSTKNAITKPPTKETTSQMLAFFTACEAPAVSPAWDLEFA